MCAEQDKAFSIVLRHSIKPDSAEGGQESPLYPGISERGVELAAAKAKEVFEIIKQAPPNVVVFIGAVSEMPRARSTAQALADNLEQLSKADDSSTVFISRSTITTEIANPDRTALGFVRTTINNHPTSRVIVDFPLFLKQLSLEKSGLLDSEIDKLLDESGDQDEIAAVRKWVASWNRTGDLLGPNPTEVARQYSRAIERMFLIAKKIIPERQFLPLVVGHSWAIDVFLGYLAAGKIINLEAFDDVTRGGLIHPLELAEVDVTERPQVRYRDRVHEPAH